MVCLSTSASQQRGDEGRHQRATMMLGMKRPPGVLRPPLMTMNSR